MKENNSVVYRVWIFNIVPTFLILSLLFLSVHLTGQSTWRAPDNANSLVNPIENNSSSLKIGKILYKQYCGICHGDKGKGDGMAGMSLKPRPANFKKPLIQNQTDGALYWKITEGKAPMAGYKETLSEKQRWHLVNFIRSLKS